MPRNISGLYSLPAGNPVIGHETIESDWANTTMPDIAAALTDSLSRSGSGGMLVPFRFIDGSISAPGITFANEPTTGIYRAGLNDVRVAIGSQDVLLFSLGGITIPVGKTLTGAISGSITGGSINNTPIGATTPNTGAFTTLTSTGGALNGTIGAITPNTGAFTTAVASSSVTTPTVAISATQNIAAVGMWYQTAGPRLVFSPPAAGTGFQWNNAGNLAQIMGLTNTGGLSTTGSMTAPQLVSSVVGPTADAQLSFTVNGATRWGILPSASAYSLVPASADNAQDLGVAGLRVRTGYFGTSVVTPLVVSPAATALTIQSAAGAISLTSGGGVVRPSTDNVDLLGDATHRWQTGYFGTSVVTPQAITGAGGTAFGFGNANAQWQVSAANADLIPLNDNVRDFGGPAFRLHTGYFGTSVVTPLVQTTSGGSLTLETIANQSILTKTNGVNRTWTDVGGFYPDADNSLSCGKLTNRWAAVYAVTFVGNFTGTLVPAFESGEFTLVANTDNNVAHGLGRVPKMVLAFLRCKIAELGYAVGDEILLSSMMFDSATWRGLNVYSNATSVGATQYNAGQLVFGRTGSIGLPSVCTAANWRIFLRAW